MPWVFFGVEAHNGPNMINIHHVLDQPEWIERGLELFWPCDYDAKSV